MATYWATVYEIHAAEGSGSGTVAMTPGEAAPEALPGIGTAWRRVAVITACNPFSERLSAHENAARHRVLEQAVRQSGRRYLPASGRDPVGMWPAEASLAVVDATDEELDEWMLQFAQNALVTLERGGLVELREHPHELERVREDPWSAQRSACRVWRSAWEACDAVQLSYMLQPHVVLASQWSSAAIRGRDAVLEHLAYRFEARRNDAEHPLTEQRIELATATVVDPVRPCVVTFQGPYAEPRCVTVFGLDRGLVSQVELCKPSLYRPILREG